MGLLEFFILVFVVVVLSAMLIYALKTFAPNHPAMIDNIVWFVAILVIVVTLLFAVLGHGHDVRIPHI